MYTPFCIHIYIERERGTVSGTTPGERSMAGGTYSCSHTPPCSDFEVLTSVRLLLLEEALLSIEVWLSVKVQLQPHPALRREGAGFTEIRI